MQLTTWGYDLKFIQKSKETYVPCHRFTYVFKFFSVKSRLHYIVRAEQHDYDFFAIKFYPKSYGKSERKYSVTTNKGDIANVLVTCAKVVPKILELFPNASFGFIGSRSIDFISNKAEGYVNNQRFKIYAYHIPQLIGDDNFVHIAYKNASAYMLVNRHNDLQQYQEEVKTMILEHYENVLNLT